MRSLSNHLLILILVLLLLSGCTQTPGIGPEHPPGEALSTAYGTGRWVASSKTYDSRDTSAISTQLFNANTLPAGSWMELGSSYACQIVAWTNYASREGAEVLENINTIPDDFWSKYDACAFNISVADSSKTLEDAMKDVTLFAPAGQVQPFRYDWNHDGTLKILTVGNSFSEDMMEHVYSIARNLGIQNIELGNLSYGGCRLYQHYDFWTNKETAYSYKFNTTGLWQTKGRSTFEAAFSTTDWDYICFQESAQEIQSTASLYQHLPALMQMAKQRCPGAKIIWHMPWANQHSNYEQSIDAMYADLCKAVRMYIEPLADIQLVIPCGTAIQNMRTSYANGQDLLTRDNWHLSQDVGRYVAGLTLVAKLTGLDISAVTWTPKGRAETLREICIESAVNAVKNPYTVTQSAYPDAPET